MGAGGPVYGGLVVWHSMLNKCTKTSYLISRWYPRFILKLNQKASKGARILINRCGRGERGKKEKKKNKGTRGGRGEQNERFVC